MSTTSDPLTKAVYTTAVYLEEVIPWATFQPRRSPLW
jgi:hypothetical protein